MKLGPYQLFALYTPSSSRTTKYITTMATTPATELNFWGYFSAITTIDTKNSPIMVIEMDTIHPSSPYCSRLPPAKMMVSPVFWSRPVKGTSWRMS